MKKILFVCTGNTCRSPMAEAVFNHGISREPHLAEAYKAESAGLSASEGEPISRNSDKVLSEVGIDHKKHRSRRIGKHLVDEAELVLTMSMEHKENLVFLYPSCKGRVFTLKEYAVEEAPEDYSFEYDFAMDIADPFGRPVTAYRECLDEIAAAVEGVIGRLKKL